MQWYIVLPISGHLIKLKSSITNWFPIPISSLSRPDASSTVITTTWGMTDNAEITVARIGIFWTAEYWFLEWELEATSILEKGQKTNICEMSAL